MAFMQNKKAHCDGCYSYLKRLVVCHWNVNRYVYKAAKLLKEYAVKTAQYVFNVITE